MIFSRRRGSKRGDGADQQRSADADRDAAATVAAAEQSDARSVSGEPEATEHGPYDAADAPEGRERLDLGALHIPVVEGVEVRVQADPEGNVQQVALVAGDNALQLGVFAAPKTESIWDEVRAELRSQLRGDGFASQETEGEYGPELRARVRTPEGPMDLRFVGIDGPRWLVRAVFQGPVALDLAVAPQLIECLRGVVVHRGGEAMPVREPLALRLPREITDQAKQQSDAEAEADGAGSTADADGGPRRRPGTRR